MEGVPTKKLGRATLIDHKKLSRPIGPLERGLLFNEEKRHDSKIVVLMRTKTKVTLVPEMAREAPLLLAKRYPLLSISETFKISKEGEGSNEYFTDVDDRTIINFQTSKEFTADDLELVLESESDTALLTHSHDHSMYPLYMWPAETHASRTAEWVDIVRVFYDRRSGKFKCTSVLNKLRLKRRDGIFRPTSVDKSHSRDFVSSKQWQIHWWNMENEWFIYDLSTKDLHFT